MHTKTPFSLTNKLAIVTGGGTGIGFGISTALILAGARVIIIGRREAVLQKSKEELGANCHYICFDINDKKSIPRLVSEIESDFGPIDILINNAGIHLKKLSLDTTDEEFDAVFQTNLLSVFSLTRECVKKMTERKSGSIIFISSMTGLFGLDKVVAYGTSKTALIGMMRQMVMEYSASNIRVNSIAPGWIHSDMMEGALNGDKERKEKILSRIPFKNFGEAEDIGNAVVYLCSDAAKYVTGVTLPVDGGATFAF